MTKKWLTIFNTLDYAFQPIVYSHTGKIYAVEALIRNTDKFDYFKNIHDLFDLAYEENMLFELDQLLREKAINKFSQIKIENLKLFYNLDNRIIYECKSISDNNDLILEKYNLTKDIFCFELSERGKTIEKDSLSKLICEYKSKDYTIAIDDFGVGVSGLKLLYFAEANIIKLDRFFISNIHKDSKKKLFCISIIEMAHTMGIKVVAEGVEEINEFYTCKDIGADYIQGYLVQKPTIDITNIKPIYDNIIGVLEKDKRKDAVVKINKKYIENIIPINHNESLSSLFLYFKDSQKYNFVPVVNDNNILLGIIYEMDIKKISYSQYGLSLSRNKAYASTLKKYIKPILSIESTWGIDKTLETFNHNQEESTGIFITTQGEYKGFINLNSLLTISYNRNLDIAMNQNPLTSLPGNKQIEQFISTTLNNINRTDETTHMLYFDFNDFKPFNDHYGFRLGDRAILIFSDLLQKKYSNTHFIAHVGGDDFFVGIKNTKYEEVYTLTSKVMLEFEESVKNLYDQKDKDNKYIFTKDRFNIQRKFKLLSVSCALLEISNNSKQENFDYTLNILKKNSKRQTSPLSASI